jgi:hypothetical protein
MFLIRRNVQSASHVEQFELNESFNFMVWCRCLKGTYVFLTTLQLSVMYVVRHFNCDKNVEGEVLKRLFVTLGIFTVDRTVTADKTLDTAV